MNAKPIALHKAGLVTSVGLSAAASCAAMRARLSSPGETAFVGSEGAFVLAHQVVLDAPRRGLAKLAEMAAMAMEEALEDTPRAQWPQVPLLLCVAEAGRPGRLDGLDDALFGAIEQRLGARFAPSSAVVAHGRVGVAVALQQARALLDGGRAARVLLAAADSFITAATLDCYGRADRLLTERNSNGFMPGEGAGALLVGPAAGGDELLCEGIAFAREQATVDSGAPLRADGLTQAMKSALAQAGWDLGETCYRIADLSGEQYYFKEASLALSRAIRYRKDNFELWHPAESMGEAGAASAMACLAVALAAAARRYAPAARAILHFSNDEGPRAVVLVRAGAAS